MSFEKSYSNRVKKGLFDHYDRARKEHLHLY